MRNAAFRQDGRGGPGTPVPLHSVSCWAGLSEQVRLEGVPGPLFGFFRVPQANWVDPCSPLGVSVYSRAVGLIRRRTSSGRESSGNMRAGNWLWTLPPTSSG